MKSTYKLSAVLIIMSILISNVALASEPKIEINHVPDFAFLPQGFDDNDNAQLVLDGRYPDTCHKFGPTVVNINRAEHKIFIESKAYYFTNIVCYRIYIPYTKVVNLGYLDPGTYEVFTSDKNNAKVSMGSLSVGKGTPGPFGTDDYLYAPVEEVTIDNNSLVGDHHVLLRGTYTNTCTEITEIKVIRDSAKVFVVLPIMTVKETGCEEKDIPFEVRAQLSEVPEGKVLVHVRAMNGNSLNRLIKFQ